MNPRLLAPAVLVLGLTAFLSSTWAKEQPAKPSMDFSQWKNRPAEPFDKGAAMFQHVMAEMQKKYYKSGIKEDELYRAAIEGMLKYADPEMGDWNQLLTPTEYKELQTDIRGNIVGVGVEISFDEETGLARIENVIPNTPAAKAGLRDGDQILKIDEQSFRRKQLRDLVYAIRGQAGSQVNLTVLRDADIKTFRLTRNSFVWDTVQVTRLPGDSAVLNIRNFTEATPERIRAAMNDLKRAPLKSLVIDLRGNEGGLFEKTTESADLLLPKGRTIVRITRRGDKEEAIQASVGSILPNVPTAVIVDESTKSGAEIMAAALKMSAGATLVGGKTFGKWSAQQIEELPNGFALRYTIARFRTPGGTDPNGKGLMADIPVFMEAKDVRRAIATEDAKERLEIDTQLAAALKVLQNPGR